MTDWREELIEKMAKGMCIGPAYHWTTFIPEARAALAVAEPAIREWCAETAAAAAKEHLTDAVAAIVAAAIWEGGKDD